LVRELLSRHRGLAGLVAVGAALRVLALVAVWPGIWFSDSNTYVEAAATGTLSPIRPVGYSLLVAPFHALGSAAALIVLQHILGLALAVGIYALLLRRGAPRWLALLGAAPAALDLYLVFVEHTLMAETVYHAALLGSVGLLVWNERPGLAAVAGAGLLLGYVGTVRSVGVPFVVVFGLYLLVRRVGWRPLAVFGSGWALVLGGYALLYQHQHGTFAVTESSGMFLYGKVAPFADCDRLGELPAAERRYCPDPANRLSANAYVWSQDSPIRGYGISDGDGVRSFATRVIRDRPGRYAGIVLSGFLHYFRPGHPISGDDYPVDPWQFPSDPRRWEYPGYRGPIRRGDPARQREHPITEPGPEVARMAGDWRVSVTASRGLHYIQRVLYTPGPLLAVCVLLVGAALVRRAGAPRLRADAALLAGLGLVALLVSQLLSVFSYRYGFGMGLLLVPAGALAVTALRRP
jgi:hypothetical protein